MNERTNERTNKQTKHSYLIPLLSSFLLFFSTTSGMQEQAAKKSLGIIRDQRGPGSPGTKGLYSLLGQRDSRGRGGGGGGYDVGQNEIESKL